MKDYYGLNNENGLYRLIYIQLDQTLEDIIRMNVHMHKSLLEITGDINWRHSEHVDTQLIHNGCSLAFR